VKFEITVIANIFMARIKRSMIGMYSSAIIVMTFTVFCMPSRALAQEGVWYFQRSVDYYDRSLKNDKPRFANISVNSSEVTLGNSCKVPFNAEQYAFSQVFQPLSKDDFTERQLNRSLLKKLGFSLEKVNTVYRLGASSPACAEPLIQFFIIGDHLLVPDGVTFYSYVRTPTPNAVAATSASESSGANQNSIFSGYKVTHLPFDYSRYSTVCRKNLLNGTRRPHSTDKCAPDFFPYIADPKSSNPLMRLVGNHDYAKGGSEYASGFSPPFKEALINSAVCVPVGAAT
jgi:hypothetical protein